MKYISIPNLPLIESRGIFIHFEYEGTIFIMKVIEM